MDYSCGLSFLMSRMKFWKILLLIILVLTTIQFIGNLMFYRNSDSIFFVNSTYKAKTPTILGLVTQMDWAKMKFSSLQSSFYKSSTKSTSLPLSAARHSIVSGNNNNNNISNIYPNSTNVSSKSANSKPTITDSKNSSNNNNPSINKNLKLALSDSINKGVLSNKKLLKWDYNIGRNVKGISMASADVSIKVPASIGNELLHDNKVNLSKDLPKCPPVPPDLRGSVVVSEVAPPLIDQEKLHPELEPGGRLRPHDCQALHRVAIIIPYRDREDHLAIFLNHLHPFLQRQQVDYAIFIIEQAGNGKFNRALLMNIGSLEAVKLYHYDCFIFHDIDLLPEDDRNLYNCPQQPRHMSIAIDSMEYKLPYNDIFGGVSAMSVDQFWKVNGFSNKFWGWGGEDDDMSNRIKYHGFYISRYPANIARYSMLTHKKDKPNPRRYQYLYDGKRRFRSDGLNSAKYHVLDIQLRRLYTWIYVEVYPS